MISNKYSVLTGTMLAFSIVSAPALSADGKAVYEATCKMCHGAGMMGAPKLTDKAAWAPRLAQGEDILVEHAIKGFNKMMPKGGNSKLTDDEVKAAVVYIMNETK